jgi:hypothetical protein
MGDRYEGASADTPTTIQWEVFMAGRSARFGIVILAALLLTLACGAVVAHAAASKATTLGLPPKVAATAPAAPAAQSESSEPATAAAAGEKPSEMDFKVGNLTEAQKADLVNAGSMGSGGYNTLIVSILGLIVVVGIVVYAAMKQSKV